ncbi:MAG: hypothetical protein HYS12_15225 [Planctomycetes bacterium]|nr:hypothetical protein [Planctomycetota bacterium]
MEETIRPATPTDLCSDWEVPKELIELMARIRAEEAAPVRLLVKYE